MQDSNTAAVPEEGITGLQPTPVFCKHQLLLQTGKYSWRGFKKGSIQLPGACSTLGKPSVLLQCSRKLDTITALSRLLEVTLVSGASAEKQFPN